MKILAIESSATACSVALCEDEKLLATGEFTFFCVDPEIMARKVKKA